MAKGFHATSLCLVLLVTACGRGSSKKRSAPKAAVPDLAILFVSGHNGPFDGSPSESYLDLDAGPEIIADLQAAGYTVAAQYYVDDGYPVGGFSGYLGLLDDLKAVRDQWVPFGTNVILIAHSHGGVWAHAATEAIYDVPIRCLVDLDTSSYGWGLVGHDLQNGLIGYDPRDAFVTSSGTYYDLEDVVFMNVTEALEVRSGDSPDGIEEYDESWILRFDGTVTNLWSYFSGTTHNEVHAAGGSTLEVVRDWLRDRLATNATRMSGTTARNSVGSSESRRRCWSSAATMGSMQ